MSKKLTTEEFIGKARKVHGDKYDYSRTTYHGNHSKLKITCKIHGEFEQEAGGHLQGHGCLICGGHYLFTSKEFINRAQKIHGHKYNYSKVNYKNARSKVTIICPYHGEFKQMADSHLRGIGCYKCGREKTVKKNTTTSKEEFINKAILIHGNRYSYKKVNYKNRSSKVIITCLKHGDFKQTPQKHLNNRGCPTCALEYRANLKRKPLKRFLKEAKKIHDNKYDYSLVKYYNSKSKIKIICPIHGIFKQSPSKHISGQGCPVCSTSHAEREIVKILDNKKIKYEYQKTFGTCINPKTKANFVFDFYLCNYNILIEYDGQQHFKKMHKFQDLHKQKLYDRYKTLWAYKNGYKLIRIPYTVENLEEEILKILTKIN